MKRLSQIVARSPARGVLALALLSLVGCGEPQTAGLSAGLGSTQGSDARLSKLLWREISRPPEIAALLFELEAVAERLAHLGSRRLRHKPSLDFARESLAELREVHTSLEQNCTHKRAESTLRELTALRGQERIAELTRGEEQLAQRYLFSVVMLGAEALQIFDEYVAPRAAPAEEGELKKLRAALFSQAKRAEALLVELD